MPRVVTYNVRHCRGVDGIVSPARIAQVLAGLRPDIVALQEVDVGRARSGGIDQARSIAQELAMTAHFHPSIELMEERYGNAVLTVFPARLIRAGLLPHGPRHAEARSALWIETTIGGRRLQVINTHLGLYPHERSRQVGALLSPEWIGHASFADPALILGDFNAPPWGRSYRRLDAALRERGMPVSGLNVPATFPSRFPTFRLDHVLASRSITILSMTAGRTPLARVASDHLPLVVDFDLQGAGRSRESGHPAEDRHAVVHTAVPVPHARGPREP